MVMRHQAQRQLRTANPMKCTKAHTSMIDDPHFCILDAEHTPNDRHVCGCVPEGHYWTSDKPYNDEVMETINHPPHYNLHRSGVECIEIVEHFNFCIGNAIKYLWRCGLKGDEIEDLRKARWYIDREIQRRDNERILQSQKKQD